ncbi:uncharacterized protein [Parasteatoda tepidariorum]|uniref:uncharacterized protein n=1 Tax=Parasteatoda tepidariorum TaxID=114398 RepID=UPI0039BD8348
MDFNTSAKYQQWDANYGMTAELRLPEFFMNHPRIAPPPPGFPHHFPSKGRHQRRNKSKHPRFDSCSMHFCRQSYPHEHIFQNDYGNQNLDFGPKKNETGIDYSWNPKGCSRGAYNFSPNTYRFPTYDYASAGCYNECPPKLESVTKMSSLIPVGREMKSPAIESHYSRGPRASKNNNMQRKRKRHFSRERVNVHAANESSSHENSTNGVSSAYACSSNANVATEVRYGGQTTLENYDEMFHNETQLAVTNLEFCQNDLLGNLEQPCENSQENQISETVTLFADDANASAHTNSEDAPGPFSYSLLNDIFSGIGEVETLENINVCDDKKVTNTLLADSGSLLPCSGSGTDAIETTINLPNDPVTSLIQQNQILIDLLSKIINNSDIFKVANGNKDLGETSTFSEQDQKAPEINVSRLPGVTTDDFTFCSESVSSPLERNTSNSNNETDTMVSINNGTVPCHFRNETEDLYEKTDSLINCLDDYEVHKNEMVVRENRLLSSGSLNEEFSEVKTHSRSVTHCVLDERKATCQNVDAAELEDTGSLTEDDHKTSTVIEREETVIRKSSIQKKTVSKMVNGYDVQDLKQCQVMMKSLSGCGSCCSSISCSVKNHTEDGRQAAESDDFNVFSKTRTLRSSMKCEHQPYLENENSEVNTLEEGENDTLSCSDIHSKRKERRNEKKVKMTEKEIDTSPNTSKTNLTSTKKRSVSRKH